MGEGSPFPPPSDFIAKNQLAREGFKTVFPVTTIVDRQFKEDRTLCPEQALRYCLDRIKDLRGSRSLLFISFKKGHCRQADQQSLDLVQVKAHDIRAFVASKAFYGGFSGQNHASLSLEGTQYIQNILHKRPDLVRQ